MQFGPSPEGALAFLGFVIIFSLFAIYVGENVKKQIREQEKKRSSKSD